jgi:hypothetical protein
MRKAPTAGPVCVRLRPLGNPTIPGSAGPEPPPSSCWNQSMRLPWEPAKVYRPDAVMPRRQGGRALHTIEREHAGKKGRRSRQFNRG